MYLVGPTNARTNARTDVLTSEEREDWFRHGIRDETHPRAGSSSGGEAGSRSLWGCVPGVMVVDLRSPRSDLSISRSLHVSYIAKMRSSDYDAGDDGTSRRRMTGGRFARSTNVSLYLPRIAGYSRVNYRLLPPMLSRA